MRARYGAIGRGDIYSCQRRSMADYIRAAEAYADAHGIWMGPATRIAWVDLCIRYRLAGWGRSWAELLARAEQAFGRRKAQKGGRGWTA